MRDWLVDHQPDWTQAQHRPGRRSSDPPDLWWTCPAPSPSAEGYRIIWVKSSAKRDHDATTRHNKIAAGIAALDRLNQRLASPKTRIKTAVAAENAAAAALNAAGAARWISTGIEPYHEHTYRQDHDGRPLPSSRYRRQTRTRHRVNWRVNDQLVARDAASDGCFPLITNDPTMTPAQLLAAYKWQPNLEQRHAQLKGTQLVAPVLLHDPARIEGLLCCHFIAMLIQALAAALVPGRRPGAGPEIVEVPHSRITIASSGLKWEDPTKYAPRRVRLRPSTAPSRTDEEAPCSSWILTRLPEA